MTHRQFAPLKPTLTCALARRRHQPGTMAMPRLGRRHAIYARCRLSGRNVGRVRVGTAGTSGGPTLAMNLFGAGRASYVASRNVAALTDDFMRSPAVEVGIKPSLEGPPQGVTVQRRTGGTQGRLFLLNVNPKPCSVLTEPWCCVEPSASGVEVRKVC